MKLVIVLVSVLALGALLVKSVPVAPGYPSMGNFPSLLLTVKRNKIQPKELHEECDDCQPKPLPRDLNTNHLTILIGGHDKLDFSVVSIVKPTDFTATKPRKVSLGDASRAKRRALRELVRNGTRNMADFSGTLSRDMERFMMGWLLQQEQCPLVHTWRDMGPHFWPRYIKRANCVNKQCSINPDSTCEPSANRYFPVLRWHCMNPNTALSFPKWGKPRAVQRSGQWCRWVRFHHPITTECSCACASKVARQ